MFEFSCFLTFLFSCFLAFFVTVLFSHYHFLSSIPTLRFLPLYCLSCFCLLLSLCRLLFFLSLHLASCFPLAGPLSACLFKSHICFFMARLNAMKIKLTPKNVLLPGNRYVCMCFFRHSFDLTINRNTKPLYREEGFFTRLTIVKECE